MKKGLVLTLCRIQALKNASTNIQHLDCRSKHYGS
jgi:hypothetical protein